MLNGVVSGVARGSRTACRRGPGGSIGTAKGEEAVKRARLRPVYAGPPHRGMEYTSAGESYWMDEDHESLAWPLGPYAVKSWSLSCYTLAFVDTVAISAALKAQRTYACSPGVAAETRRSSQITVMILVGHPLDASIIIDSQVYMLCYELHTRRQDIPGARSMTTRTPRHRIRCGSAMLLPLTAAASGLRRERLGVIEPFGRLILS